jgi:hypothetical protein
MYVYTLWILNLPQQLHALENAKQLEHPQRLELRHAVKIQSKYGQNTV